MPHVAFNTAIRSHSFNKFAVDAIDLTTRCWSGLSDRLKDSRTYK